jgi:hypothetical protein
MNRSSPLRPALAPLTPTIPEPRPSGKISHDEACTQLLELRHIVTAERKRHSQSERALTKYIEILERHNADLIETFRELGQPLLPSPLGRAARKH